ncbi:MAG: rod shape-determining protein MreD [Kiloniellales bacterium]
MRQTFWTRLDGFARALAPTSLTLLLVIVGLLPMTAISFSAIFPSLALIGVYYWQIHRPDLMPLAAVFVLGLLADFLGGGTLGVGTIALLVVALTVGLWRRFFVEAAFLATWLIFALIAGGAFALMWLLASFAAETWIEPRPALFQYFSTVALYPCFAWLFVQAQRTFLR